MRSIIPLALAFLLVMSAILSCDAMSPYQSETPCNKIPRGGSSYCCDNGIILKDDTSNIVLEHSLQSKLSSTELAENVVQLIDRGGGWIPAGYNPFGYQITELGEQFLAFEGSLDSDVGRFLASVRERKSVRTIRSQWLEVVRASKKGQSMRIYRALDDFVEFCLKAGFLN